MNDRPKTLLERALEIAVEAHLGKVDKAGAPYLFHPMRLALKMGSEQAMITALLHDVIEDAGWTRDALEAEGFSQEVLDALECLSKRPEEKGSDAGYEAFIGRITRNELARRVKLADLEDNMNLLRLKTLGEKDLQRQAKYHRAWRVLQVER